MKLDKAIEIKERTGDAFLNTDPDEVDQAEALSIEALKRIKGRRDLKTGWEKQLLPGETSPKPLDALGFNTGDDESP